MRSLDLHGFKKDEVFDAVDRFLLKNSNEKTVKIVCGKGTGVVRNEVISYLKQANYPWSHEKVNGKPNEGVIIVYME